MLILTDVFFLKYIKFKKEIIIVMRNKEVNYYKKAFLINLFLGLILVGIGFILGDGNFYFITDYNMQQIPFNAMMNEAIKNGDFLYLDSLELGANLIAAQSFYSIGSVFFLITLIFPSSLYHIITPLFMALKFAVGGTTAFVFTKRYVKNLNWAIVAGLLYTFSSYQIANLNFHFIDYIVLFPLLLASLDSACLDNKKGRFAIVVALLSFTNYIFFVYSVVFLVIYFLIKVISKEYILTKTMFLRLSFESIIGFLISSVIVIPSVLFTLGNPRVTNFIFDESIINMLVFDKIIYADIIRSLLLPAEAILNRGFITQYNVCASELYLPVVGIILPAAYIFNNKKSWISKTLITSLIFAFVPILNSSFSMFNSNYYARWGFMPLLIMALATAKHLDDEKSFKKGYIAFGILAAIFLLIAFIWEQILGGEFTPNLLLALLLIFVSLAGVIATVITEQMIKKKFKFTNEFFIICVFFSVMASFTLNTYYHHKTYDHLYQSIPADEIFNTVPNIKFPDDEEYYRIQNEEYFINTGLMANVPTVNSFNTSVSPSSIEFYVNNDMNRDVNSFLNKELYGYQTLLGVKYILSKDENIVYMGESINYSYTDSGVNFFENPYFIGMGFNYDNAISKYEYSLLNQNEKQIAVIDAVVIEDTDDYKSVLNIKTADDYKNVDIEDFILYQEDKNQAYDFKFNNAEYSFKINLDKKEVVFVSIPYDSRFICYVNGEEVETSNVNNGFIGITADKGINEINLKYQPIDIYISLFITALASLILIFYIRKSEKIHK